MVIPTLHPGLRNLAIVVPAKAGTHTPQTTDGLMVMGPRLRGDDSLAVYDIRWLGRLAEKRIARHYFQNCFVAIAAPSAIALSLANTTSGSTAAWPTQVP